MRARCGRSSPTASRPRRCSAPRCGPRRSPPPAGRSPASVTVAAVRAVGTVGSRGRSRRPARRRKTSARRTSSPAAPSLSTFTSSVAERRPARPLELEVEPPSPYALPRFGGEDRVMRIRGGIATRLLRVEGSPVLVRAWQPGRGRVALRAEPARRRLRCRCRRPAASSPAPGGARAARAGARADALRARGRRRPRRVLPPLPPRPAARAADPAAPAPAPAAPALGLGGARLGRRQAADRDRPGGADPAPHRRSLGAAPRAASAARRCATCRRPS